MPELAFLLWKSLEQPRRDHIFDSNEASVLLGGIVDNALTDVYVKLMLSPFMRRDIETV